MIRFGRRKRNYLPARSRTSPPSPSRPATPESAPADQGFAGDEERFFNEHDLPSAEATAAAEQERECGSTLAPTVMSGAEESSEASSLPSEQQERDTLPGSAALHARRRRLRQTVVIALCASAAILLLGVARRPVDGIHAKASAAPAQLRALATPALPLPTHLETPNAPVTSASASTPLDDRAAQESGHALVLTARSLLQAGRIRAGVSAARRALAANNSDPEPYILLAAGLQDLGDWQGAQSVFDECTQKARRGSSADCRYFSGRRH